MTVVTAPPSLPGRSPSRFALALALTLPAVGLAECAAAARLALRPPVDFLSAKPVLALEKQPGDVVQVLPRWQEPHARAALGDAFFPLEEVARADETRVTRALVLGGTEERSPEHAGWPERARHPLPGGFFLRVLENPAVARVVTDLLARAGGEGLSVAVARGDDVYPCTYSEHAPVIAPGLFGHPSLPPRRYICGDERSGVGITVQDDERFRPRRCLFVPVPAGGRVMLRFPAVALGNVLRGHAGVFWTLQRERKGAPVLLDVALDGVLLQTTTQHEGEGFALFTMPLGARAHTAAEVTITLRTEGSSARPFCFEADTRE